MFLKKILAPLFLAMSLTLSGTGFALANSTVNFQLDDPQAQLSLDRACMATAVEKRENALLAAVDTFYTAMRTAYTTRRDRLKAAWSISDSDDRHDAISDAWHDFLDEKNDRSRQYRRTRRTAWANFRTEARLCGRGGQYQDRGGMHMDLKH